jgi:hypothetical protein
MLHHMATILVSYGDQWRTSPYPMAPNSKNDDDHQFARARSTWKPNLAQIGGFLALPQLPWKQKKGDIRNCWIPFIKLHETL